MVATVLDGAKVLVARDLRHEGTRWRGEIEVLFGTYAVVLEAYIGSLVKWRGQRSAVVRAGKTTRLPVQMDLNNVTPTADAGSDTGVTVGATVYLNGSASSDADGDILAYVWRQVLGPAVVLSGDQTVRPSFVAAQAGDYRFALSVSDGVSDSPNDGVAVTVRVPNRAPVADAGQDQSVQVGATVQVDGSASRDPDGDPLTYTWRQVLGPAVTLQNAGTEHPSFVASEPGEYRLAMCVSDGGLESVCDGVAVSVTAWSTAPNRPPVADAGTDQLVTVGENVQLDGSASSDPDGDPMAYTWRQVLGPAVTLRNATTARPSYAASGPGEYRFALSVSDGKVDSAPDDVAVSVTTAPVAQNREPVADAGADQTVTVGTTARLDGSASNDPDGDQLRYTWRQILGPTMALQGAQTTRPSFTPTKAGEYRFALVVSDAKLDSAPDGVVITAQGATPTTGDAQVIGEVEEGTGDAQVTGDVEENRGDAQVIGEVIE
jgi:hypothetical protein